MNQTAHVKALMMIKRVMMRFPSLSPFESLMVVIAMFKSMPISPMDTAGPWFSVNFACPANVFNFFNFLPIKLKQNPRFSVNLIRILPEPAEENLDKTQPRSFFSAYTYNSERTYHQPFQACKLLLD